MSVRVQALGRPLRPRTPAAAALGVGLLASGALVGLVAVKAEFLARLIVGASVIVGYLIVALGGRRLALSLVVVWLTFLGFVRRALIPFVGWPQFDPLLLIGPICAAILWLTHRERMPRTVLSTLVMLLFGLSTAQIFNPNTGGILAGLLGSLFWAGPLLWFFVGRSLGSEDLERIYRLVTVLLVPVAFHGLRQSFGAFLPFEYTWLDVSDFGAAIFMPGFKIRPFSTLTSPQEYGFFLSFGLTVLWSRILTERGGRAWKVPLFLFAGLALFLQGGRQTFAFFLLMLIVTAALHARVAGSRLLAVSFVGFLVVLGSMQVSRPADGAAPPPDPSTSHAETLARHQIEGFTNPQASTLPLHRDLIVSAFRSSWDQPFGVGTGAGSLARRKLTGDERPSSENDIAATFVALGIPGGLLLVTFMVASFVQAVRRHRAAATTVSLAAAGILVAFLTQWWAGQMYTVSALFWLTLGWLSRPGGQDAPAA